MIWIFFFLLQPSEFISVTVKNKVRETSVQMKSWNIYQLNNVGLFQSLLLSKSCSLLSEDLKVWRADPGSIFDFDPLQDNIQSKSLRRMSGSSGSSRNVFKLKYFAYLHTSLMTLVLLLMIFKVTLPFYTLINMFTNYFPACCVHVWSSVHTLALIELKVLLLLKKNPYYHKGPFFKCLCLWC